MIINADARYLGADTLVWTHDAPRRFMAVGGYRRDFFFALLIYEMRARQRATLPHTLRLASFGYHAVGAAAMLYVLDDGHSPMGGMPMSATHRNLTQLDWFIFSLFMGDAVLVALAAILLPKVLARLRRPLARTS